MDETASKYHLHQSYWTHLEALGVEDADDLHSLAVAVNWPHRPQDMDTLLELGQGIIARDDIGRPMGAGMSFAYGADAAMVGMMMTHPKLQAGGLGREMLNSIETGLEGRQLRLNATRPAWRLYRSAGFSETGTVVQYQGLVRRSGLPAMSKAPRLAGQADLAAIQAMDRAVFGADRAAVLAHLFARSQTRVIETEGRISGYAFCRAFGRGHLIGPMAACSEADAIALAGPFVATQSGTFLRLDADARHAELGAFLNAVGLENYDTVVPMTKGKPYGPEQAPDRVYALASQALG